MPIEVKLAFYILQIVLQVFAIYICVHQIKSKVNNGARVFWKWFLAGFTFQLVRRLLAIIWLLEIPFPDIKTVTLILVPTCVSVCYALAMYEASKYLDIRRKAVADERLKKNRRIKELECEFQRLRALSKSTDNLPHFK